MAARRTNRGRAHRQELFDEGVKRQEERDARGDEAQLAHLLNINGGEKEFARLKKRIEKAKAAK